jgi:transcriptional regulator with XRE-family HTH domain
MKTIAEIIKMHRKKADLTQADLSRLSGVGKTVIWKVENGHQSIQWNSLEKLFRILNVGIEWRSPILDREGPAPAKSEGQKA